MMTSRVKCFGVVLILSVFFLACQTTNQNKPKAKEWTIFASKDTEKLFGYVDQIGGVDAAIKDLESKAKKSPQDLEILEKLGRVYLIKQDRSKALAVAQKISQIDFRSRAAKILAANVAYMNQSPDEAELILNGLGGVASKDAEVLNLLAGVALHRKDDKKSIEFLKKALQISPSYAAAYLNLGLLYLRHNEFELAKSQFEKILTMKPKSWEARLNLALCQVAINKPKEAYTIYKQLYSEDSRNDELIYYMAAYFLREKLYDEALDKLEEYIELGIKDYNAKIPATKFLNEIRIQTAKSEAVDEQRLTQLAKRIKDMPEPKEKNSKLNQIDKSFVFTSVGYVNN